MILLFGGTTEGRKAITELEEAGQVFYYSTKTGEQDVPLHHGVAVHGAMDAEAMTAFCREHDIRLLIDAAHPFAAQLHQTVADVAVSMGIPAIRFERLYPERDPSLVWCDDFQDAVNRFSEQSLLATTGVQTIGLLQPLEKRGVKMWYRILPRQSSIALAKRQGATDEQLCFYQEDDDDTALLRRLRPEAVIMKESGLSGGFVDKVNAAQQLGIKVYVVKRPLVSAVFHTVNGEHGLRRMVERLLPEFYPLHSGLTTGTYATAAAVAQTRRLFHDEMPSEVPVVLPNGETIMVGVGYGDDYAFAKKVSGDDPDVTDGIEIRANIRPADSFCVKGGEGVGIITLPGFDYPPGEAAINRVPREMLRRNIQEEVEVTISVPEGREIARRTFNPRLGIVDGISIIGVSGIIKPFSEEAFIDSIRKCMEVAKASGSPRVVINSGAKSERFVKALYPDLPMQAFVEYGNYIGETLKFAAELHIPSVTLGVMMGKAVKLAAGQLDTHSRRGTMDKDFIHSMLLEAGCHVNIDAMTLARELWSLIPSEKIPGFCRTVIRHCLDHCKPLYPNGDLTILLIDEDGKVYGC